MHAPLRIDGGLPHSIRVSNGANACLTEANHGGPASKSASLRVSPMGGGGV